ncbi:SH3 domain-containing protein [Pseudalkalibacillus sp. SCS-8]|uniref:SH3 domain-containing protein n=1 Tax=Pseudalkalibacillus nanhaiensis TaxID=3115291 RepID=UPI0032DA003A
MDLTYLYEAIMPIFQLPDFLRMGALILLFGVMTILFINIIIPLIFMIATFVIKRVYLFTNYITSYVMYRVMNKRRQNHQGVSSIIDTIESISIALQQNSRGMTYSLRKVYHPLKGRKGQFFGTFILLSIAVPAIFAVSPEASYALKWKEIESNFVEEKLMPLGFEKPEDQPVNTVEAEEEEQKRWVVLKKEYNGGNLRAKPDMKAKKVDAIEAGEKALFLGQEETGSSNVKWLKVRKTNGKEGWISSNIVKFVDK